MRVALAQLNPTVGDVRGNVRALKGVLEHAAAGRAQLVVCPELYLVGYPPKDLLERGWFVERAIEGLRGVCDLSRAFPRMGILVGCPVRSERGRRSLRNAAVLIRDGEILAERYKALLPSYDVFDEERYFEASPRAQIVDFDGERLGIHICEDAWADSELWDGQCPYDRDPVHELVSDGATLLVNISASPFNVGKEGVRQRLVSGHARRHGVPFVYVNQVGANDELIFDGRSFCLDGSGNPLAVLEAFAEDVVVVDTARQARGRAYEPLDEIASVHDALILGIRDYMQKCGFDSAVLGLSGGIDSALTCYLASRAIDPEHVLGVSMPSEFSSRGSKDDAQQLAENLGVGYKVIPIQPIFRQYLSELAPHFAGTERGVAEENIQARIRGNLLMALSNKFGHLVLSTGNKSELAVGYCTLYGDMSGGLAAISDVPKMMVYALARYANRERELIPQASIDKAPSAELRPGQTDQDTLPPYEILDGILHHYVEEGRSVADIVAQGYAEDTVRWVVRTVDRNEYKRKQAAPGLRVTTKAFGVGRRMPIAAKFRA